MACSVCETARPKLLCPVCFGASCAGRQSDLRGLREQRDAAEAQLLDLAAAKEAHQRQQLQLLHISEEVGRTQLAAGETACQLQAVRQRTQAARLDLQQRQLQLRDAQQQLAHLSRQMQAAAGPQREQQAQACIRALDALAREQRTKVVRRTMQILPLTLVPPVRPASPASGPHGGAGSSGAERAAAMICSLPLPDSRASMAEVGALARSLGSALGYLALLLDLLSRFLQLPVAHRCAFQGSTSRMWQPDSFFDMRATPPNDALTLSWPKAADEWVGGGAGQQQQQQQRQEQQLRTALHTLQRSAGMLVYARLGPEAALKVPPDWPPFTWLAGLCKMLAAEPRPSSGRMAVPGPRNLAASAVFGRYSPEHGGMAQSVLFQDGGGTDEGEEEWEHLPQPAYGMIPPPPSQPEDVEHWVQAMYADNGGGSNSTGNGAAAAAASYGTSPMARLRALTRAYLGTALLLPG